MLSIGAFASLLTEATGFSRLFPGLRPSVLTLNGQFFFPLRRDIGIGLGRSSFPCSRAAGGVESSRESLRWLLRHPGAGRAVAIVVGGSAEVLDAKPGRFDLNLRCRRGFVRFALVHGAALVPLFHFGENDLYEQPENSHGSSLRTVQVCISLPPHTQTAIKNRFGFCPPLMRGRGVFWRGMFPLRRPVTSVMGAPILVDAVQGEPSLEQASPHSISSLLR